ncbi:MAG: sporulation initiation factor Spo0A C-terminal domain-containing protein [Oscillibacter ruminantium]|uniref:sporulation initiation factor Spo0A C-terminal domain-containing protein n=1 Tax=Oscillibacter ruminantium TaxID=1263547 RepID=UPI002B1EF1E0|nr:sporulation initiation factor Spo0A C-terminal domain-containing protein [Oscillibacter ruminantium]MEA5041586.1 sporulation initiation factor Spo0A C-terminal domain-containing protein [Oscillibacter ruminantium]
MNKIERSLVEVGVPASLSGFQYLVEAIDLSGKNRDLLRHITKGLYPSVAEKHKTTATRVERAMRHAIEVAFTNSEGLDIRKKYFGNTIPCSTGKPTNSEFIAMMVLNVRDQTDA